MFYYFAILYIKVWLLTSQFKEQYNDLDQYARERYFQIFFFIGDVMEKKGKLTNFIAHAEKTLPAWKVNRAKQNARKEILKMKLGDLRKELGIKQIDMDGFSQSAISRLESRTDFKISTLIDYISQLDLELEITVRPKNSKKKEFVLVKA